MERLWLAGTLWPDSVEEAALSNLRRSLHLLRNALGPQHETRLHSPSPGAMALNLDGAEADVLRFDAALRGGRPEEWQAAVALYAGPLLEDCAEDWALTERAVREEAFLAACERLGRHALASNAPAEGAACLRRALSVDPLRETAVCALMESLAAAGDHAGAMTVFRRFRRRLRRELDAAPSAETRAVFEQISAALSPIALHAPRGLPRPLTALVGRKRERAQITALLDTARLMTLTGTGGAGKTRLAIAAAEDLAEETAVCFVDLAPLSHADSLLPTVARALDVSGPCDTRDALAEHLRDRTLLLVLDNCEHLLDDCAVLAGALLAGCARLRVLATSRQPLGLPGEAVHPVPPLAVPPLGDAPGLETEYEAVQLFTARARQARPSFAADPRTLPAVARICRRLDGLPLALELAAARARSLSCEQIAEKLDDRFALLTAGNRAAPPRHQTLRAAVDWSYDLLPPAERLLLAQLSVFAGGWTPEAAEAVCGAGEAPLSELVDKSLAQRMGDADGTTRFSLLETLREYGREKLDLSGQAGAVQSRHRDFFLALAETTSPLLTGPEQATWLLRLDAERDNLRAALDWSLATDGETSGALRLCAALNRFWWMRGPLSEGRRSVEAALARPDADADLALQVKALNAAGTLAQYQGDSEGARGYFEKCLPLRLALGDTRGVAVTQHNLGMVAHQQGDCDTAARCYAEALAIYRDLGLRSPEANNINALGIVRVDQGDREGAEDCHAQALAIYREIGDREGMAQAESNLANIALQRGDLARAWDGFEKALAIRRTTGHTRGIATGLFNLSSVLHMQGEWAREEPLLTECLSLYSEVGDQMGQAAALEGFAFLAACLRQPERAARLWGAACRLRRHLHAPHKPQDEQMHECRLAPVREALSPADFAAACEAGCAMTTAQAVEYALQEADSLPP